MRAYKPRRCSKRWLDGDCPDGVLAIFDFPNERDRYDVIYAEVYAEGAPLHPWMGGLSLNQAGYKSYHFEMPAHAVAAYRYRHKHRYAKWSTLPDAVKAAVRRDLQA